MTAPDPPKLITVTVATPELAISEALIVATTEVGDCSMVLRTEWFQLTVEEESNPVPMTIRVKAGSPAVVLDGLRDVICGTLAGGGNEQSDTESTIPLIAMIATQEIARPERIMNGRMAPDTKLARSIHLQHTVVTVAEASHIRARSAATPG